MSINQHKSNYLPATHGESEHESEFARASSTSPAPRHQCSAKTFNVPEIATIPSPCPPGERAEEAQQEARQPSIN